MFGPAYQQGLIFQQAMERIVEVNGPLHMVFHMLQTLYTIYKPFMTWCIDILKWKRIKMSQILDCYKNANIFLNIVLDECERLAVDQFLYEEKLEYHK